VLSGIDPQIASQMGIPAGTPLVMGSSDAVNSSLGVGAVHPHCATCMVGTSGAFRIISPEALLDASERSWCYAIDDTHWLVGGAVNNGGIVLSWLKDVLNQAHRSQPETGRVTFDDLIGRADGIGPGAGGLISLPFLVGERSPNWNMNARGVFFGLTLQHDTGHMVRALLEGVAYRLRSVSEVLDDMGCEIREIRASGGVVRSKVWLRIMADVFGLELKIPAWGETSSMGAALWAMLGTGLIGSIDDIKDMIPLKRSFTPAEENVKCYNELFGLYKDLYTAVLPSFDRIARFQKKS
jgi:gluconokinase